MAKHVTLTIEHTLIVDDDVTLEQIMDDWAYYLDECELCANVSEASVELKVRG